MPQQLLPPDIRRLIQSLETRVSALERGLQTGVTADPAEYVFSYAGAITTTESPPVRVRGARSATTLVANLGVAGTTTTVIQIKRGGVATAEISLPAGITVTKVPVAIRFGGDQETLSIAVSAVGAGATDLTVQVRFT